MKNDGIFLQFMFKLIYLLKTISDKLRLKSYLFYMFYTNKNFLCTSNMHGLKMYIVRFYIVSYYFLISINN